MKESSKKILIAIIILFVLIPLMVKFSGVSEFTQHYETDIEMNHQIKFGSIQVYYENKKYKNRKKYSNYKTVHIGVNERGIFVKKIWILSYVQPALLFPWESISSCSKNYRGTVLEMKKTNSTVILSDEDGLLFRECILNNIGSK